MEVYLVSSNAEWVAAAAAKVCYSGKSIDDIVSNASETESEKYLEMLMDLGHESPLEHLSFTFAVKGISRACLAQLTRHRIASYSVRSQRYVSEAQCSFVVPPEIGRNEEAKACFQNAVRESLVAYKELVKVLRASYVEGGMDDRDAQKKAQEDARFVLPNACETQLMVTMNARELLHFFSLRCCNRAQWEIRELAEKMLELCRETAPNIFRNAGAPCVRGYCPEGKLGCGRVEKK